MSYPLAYCFTFNRWTMRGQGGTVGWDGGRDVLFLESQPVLISVPMLTRTLTT